MLKWNIVVVAMLLATNYAKADVQEPQSYLRLTAFERFSPAQAPQLQVGHNQLRTTEARYQEHLPLQLSGSLQKIQGTHKKQNRFIQKF